VAGETPGATVRGVAVGAVLCLLVFALSAVALEVPSLKARVNDLADLLPAGNEVALESRLAGIEASTGVQVAVLTVPSLEGEDLEDFTLRVAETWKLGQAEEDNGALLFFARDDRKMRLEVGYGLEPTLTDALSRRILDEVIRPRFQQGDFPGGIEAGVEAIGAVVGGNVEALPPPPPRESERDAYPILLFILLYAADLARSLLARRGFLGWVAVFAFAALLGFGVHQFFNLSRAILAVVVALVLLIPLRFFLVRTVGPTLGSWGSRGRRSGCTGLLWGPPIIGGGGRSSSRGGGGFSGGGGSFGGGGASSGW
jgi:uncharacterized protein